MGRMSISQTKSLTNYFLNEKNKDKIINNNIALKNKNNYQLSPIYLELKMEINLFPMLLKL